MNLLQNLLLSQSTGEPSMQTAVIAIMLFMLILLLNIDIKCDGLLSSSCCGKQERKTKHIKKHKTMPQLLPIKQSKYESECIDILSVIPKRPNMDRSQMSQKCKSRLETLVEMHAIYDTVIDKDSAYYNNAQIQNIFSNLTTPKYFTPNLLILDLYEAIINQRTYYGNFKHRSESADEYWNSMNNNELIYDFNRFSLQHRKGDLYIDPSKTKALIAIFRKDLVKFIEYTQENGYDVILYSCAIPDLLIYHAVTIELYYNFVYAAKHRLDRSRFQRRRFFEFKFVIGKIDGIRHKSFDILMRIFGNNRYVFNQYQNIVIVESDKGLKWNRTVPQEIVNSRTNITCYLVSDFVLIETLLRSEQLTNKLVAQMLTNRHEDWTLTSLIYEMQHLALSNGEPYMQWMRVRTAYTGRQEEDDEEWEPDDQEKPARLKLQKDAFLKISKRNYQKTRLKTKMTRMAQLDSEEKYEWR